MLPHSSQVQKLVLRRNKAMPASLFQLSYCYQIVLYSLFRDTVLHFVVFVGISFFTMAPKYSAEVLPIFVTLRRRQRALGRSHAFSCLVWT